MNATRLLARAFMEEQPSRAATTLEQLTADGAVPLLRAVPAVSAATVLQEVTMPFASDCLSKMPAHIAAGIAEEMELGNATAIMRSMQAAERDAVLAALKKPRRDAIELVLPYTLGTAGAVMDPTVFRLTDDALVADARVRLGRASRELLYYIYVVDHSGRLVGVLDIPELLTARARDTVGVAMMRDVESIDATMPVRLLRELVSWQRYHAMPVVDEEGRLLGAIRYQTLRGLERSAIEEQPDPGRVTAGALAELFRLGTTGLVAGITSTDNARDLDRAVGGDDEVENA